MAVRKNHPQSTAALKDILAAEDPEGSGSTSIARAAGRRAKEPETIKGSIQWHSRQSSRIVVPERNLPARPSIRVGLEVPDEADNETEEEEKEEEEDDANNTERPLHHHHHLRADVAAVFNANTHHGNSMVRALASKGVRVVAVVRVFTSRFTQGLVGIPNVLVKVADAHAEQDVHKILKEEHVTRAFLILKHWEKFNGALEEAQANMILQVCAQNRVRNLVFSSFEDTRQLRKRGLKSQIVPDKHGKIYPKFTAMQGIKKQARRLQVTLTHMITSYLDQETSKKSLCLIVGENGKLIVQPFQNDDDDEGNNSDDL